MKRIVPGIDTLDQHLQQLEQNPEAYRPACCPHCGTGGVHCHGHYLRKADREAKDGVYLDPVPILRYYCRHCRRSCSRLPSCIAPRRWYLWMLQQAVIRFNQTAITFGRGDASAETAPLLRKERGDAAIEPVDF